MKTPIMVPCHTTGPSTSAIRYSPLFGGLGAANWSSSANNAGTPVPVAGTFSDLIVRFPTLGAGSYIFTLMLAGVATTLTCTPDLTGTGIATDITHSVHITGDPAVDGLLCMRCDPNGTTPTANGHIEFSMLFTADVDGESFVVGGYVAAASAGGDFLTPGGNDGDSTAAAASMVWPTGGVIDKLYYRVSVAPGAAASAKSRTLTINKDGSDQTVTALIFETAVLGSDTSNSFSVAAGDKIAMAETIANTPANAIRVFGFRFVPTTNGESVQLARYSANPLAAADRYTNAAGSANGSVTSEATSHSLAPVAFVAKKLYVDLATAPGGATTRTMFLRRGLASTALTKQLTSTTTADNDSVNTVSIAAGDLINQMMTSSASVASTAQARSSFVAYIAPVAAPSTGKNLLLLGVG